MNENGNMSMLDQAIQTLRALEVKTDADVESALELLASARASQRRVKAMLRAAGIVEAAQPKPKTKKYPPSEEIVDRVLAAILKHAATNEPALPEVPGSFTARSITEMTGAHYSSVIASINLLRDQGTVRKVGVIAGGKGTPPPVFALDENYTDE